MLSLRRMTRSLDSRASLQTPNLTLSSLRNSHYLYRLRSQIRPRMGNSKSKAKEVGSFPHLSTSLSESKCSSSKSRSQHSTTDTALSPLSKNTSTSIKKTSCLSLINKSREVSTNRKNPTQLPINFRTLNTTTRCRATMKRL